MHFILQIFKLLLFLLLVHFIRFETFVIKNNNKIKNDNGQNQVNFNVKTNMIFTKDILFINGCNPTVIPHPFRYRVLHQIEQLKSGLLDCDYYDILSFDPKIIRFYRIIIFFRVQWTKKIGKAITLANILNKKILFDIDDLIFDTNYTDILPYLQNLPKINKTRYDI